VLIIPLFSTLWSRSVLWSADQIRIQYAENEDCEEFSDMERAWILRSAKLA
jgi:hypothetical protein